MALYSGFVVLLLYGWSYLCGGYCAMLKTDHFPDRRTVDFTHSLDKKHPAKDDQDLLLQDTMTEHMQMLYAKYNRAGFPFKDGNTIRSFKAHWGTYPRLYARFTRRAPRTRLSCSGVESWSNENFYLSWNYRCITSAQTPHNSQFKAN